MYYFKFNVLVSHTTQLKAFRSHTDKDLKTFYRVKVTDEVLAKLNMSKPKEIIHRDKILFMIYVKTNNGNTLHMCTNILCRVVGHQDWNWEPLLYNKVLC